MKFDSIRHDISAASVGALATLPQAVAYGLIAIAPLGADWAVFGIMSSIGTAIVFGLITGLWGSNRFLISGPGAVTALVIASAIAQALERGYAPEQALALAYGGIVIAGLFQVLSGWVRLGHVTSYIPVPVLSGFVNASALLVMITALPTVLGQHGIPLIDALSSHADSINLWAAFIGGITIVTHLMLDDRSKVIPGALVALALGAILYYLGNMGLGLSTAPLVGHIELSTLWREPPMLAPAIDWAGQVAHNATSIMPWQDADIPLSAGLSIGLLASFYTVIGSSALAVRTHQTIDGNNELRLHGIANALMGVLGFLPGNASPGISDAVRRVHATPRISCIGTPIMFAVLLVVMMPLIEALPLWTTAGMLVSTSLLALDRATLTKLKGLALRNLPFPRVVVGDVAETLAVVITALVVDLIAAVGVGVMLSIALFVLGMGRSPIRRIYRGSRIHSRIHRSPGEIKRLEQDGDRIAVIEVQGPLFFGSCARLLSDAKELLEDGVEFLILDFKHMTSIDSTGSAKLRSLSMMCQETGGKLMVSYIQPERRTAQTHRARVKAESETDDENCRRIQSRPRWIWLNMHANDIINVIGEDWFFRDTDSALSRCEQTLLEAPEDDGYLSPRGRIAHSDLFAGLS
ncbi:MAG: SulP family inorganic anion transporter, partial [Rhodospirillaceae bacterium]|nr:SulP family inorganic anion transporter [Rhodospirillaceae bacterium]